MDETIKRYLAENGRKGGRAGTGKSKARPSHVARKAAMTYWTSPAGLARRKKIKKEKGTV